MIVAALWFLSITLRNEGLLSSGELYLEPAKTGTVVVARFALHNLCVKHRVCSPGATDLNEEIHLSERRERQAADELPSRADKGNRLALQHFS